VSYEPGYDERRFQILFDLVLSRFFVCFLASSAVCSLALVDKSQWVEALVIG
jgi:hypothetical protein